MNKNILILGGSGYLGISVANKFNHVDNYAVTIGDIIEPSINVPFVKLNLLDKDRLKIYLNQYDTIINCTGQITTPINPCFRVNTEGTDNLVEAIKFSGSKLVHISTVAVYGTCKFADEETSLNPETPYSTCKAFSEYKIKNILPKDSFCILRLPNLYGSNQKKGLFAYLLKSYMTDRHLKFNNDGSLFRYFLNIDDCAEAILKTIYHNLTGIYNVPTMDKYSVKEVVNLIESLRGVKFKSVFDNKKPLENVDLIDFSIFLEATNFEPMIKLTNFINKTFL